jgi:hypothetical protein
MNCGIQWESFLEHDFIILLEFYRHVIAYFEQPFRAQYYVGNKRHTYVPDFLVECLGNLFKIHEVKPEEEANKPDNIRKFSIISQKYGGDFCVTTEKFIRQEPRLGNTRITMILIRASAIKAIDGNKPKIEMSDLAKIYERFFMHLGPNPFIP